MLTNWPGATHTLRVSTRTARAGELVRAPTWSDAVAAMGRGMGEAKDALLSFSLSQDSQDGPPPPPPAQE